MKNMKIAAAALAVASAFTTQAYAAGFMLTEQSAAGLGRSYAGIGVDGTDISGVFYNPATMTLHKGSHFQAGFVGIGLDLAYESADGTTENGRYKEQAIPHGYLAKQMSDNLWLGLGMTVPFGMGTEFNEGWSGRDRGVEATILTYDVNPNIAWKVNDKFSIGAGVSVQYAKAQLVTHMLIPVAGTYDDVRARLRADSLAYGWNVGLMWEPTDNVRVGLSYRSEIEHNAEGDLTIKGNMSVKNPMMFEAETTVTAPAWAMLTAAWDINTQYSVYGTFRWTDWSSFDELVIESPNLSALLPGLTGNQLNSVPDITNKWQDTYLFTVGADYRYNDKWTFRTGIGYETSPIDIPQNRMAIIPDADRWWFSVGTNYKYNENVEFDLSFAHLRGVHERSCYNLRTKQEEGRFDKLDAYLLGVQMQYHF